MHDMQYIRLVSELLILYFKNLSPWTEMEMQYTQFFIQEMICLLLNCPMV